jgi:ATP-dependent DNA helicase RecQ
MGLDIRDVQLVVHIGCPKSILSYWQEAGRCARDGRQGFSLILYDSFTLALKTTDKDMAAV